MNDDEANRPRRLLAAIAGGLAAGLLAGVVATTIWSALARHSGVSDPTTLIVVWCVNGTLLAMSGAVMGIVGAVRPITFRATAIGSVALVLLAWTAPLVQVSTSEEAAERQRVFEAIGWLAVVLAFLSISSYAGALAAGTASQGGQSRFQFSLRGLLFLFVPFAVVMGWLQHFIRK
jgi:hypothetical protein